MNFFKKNFYKKKEEKAYIHQKIIDLSSELAGLLGVDTWDMNEMVYDDYSFEVGDYLLVCVCRVFGGRWENIIEVVPKELGHSHGYSNTRYLNNGERGWHYVMKGTATECLPPKEVIDEVKRILRGEKTIEELESEIQELVKSEEYEKAEKIRLEIKKRRDEEFNH